MRLLRWGEPGKERPGIIASDGSVRDLSGHVGDLAGDALSDSRLAELHAIDFDALPRVATGVRVGPCVGGSGKIIGVGLNYADHARETNVTPPKEPVLFMKGTRLSGPHDPILIAPGSAKTDWEIELSVIIGKEALRVPRERAMSYVAGFATFVDVSERSWQTERGGQWDKGKSFPSFAPIGPWLVTADEIGDPQRLPLWLEVNGVRQQSSNTSQMLFGVSELVSYISAFMKLYPGDVIATGTPAGVGMGMKPEPVYLKAGDLVRCGVEGLGEQKHDCQALAAD
jgi:2-keto-4-pentenoate hydratase/2-oxohepta-3-ene-1,7-dioic acid hydratase in catechol pathway